MNASARAAAHSPGHPRLTLALASALLLAATDAGAVTLYDNGPVTDPAAGGRCDSGPSAFACGGSGSWTFYDDFALASDATLTGFDYIDWFDFGSPADYLGTTWSLFDGNPLVSAPIASGSSAAALTPTGPADQYRFEVAGLAIALSAGTPYWLGVSNVLGGSEITSVARVDDPGGGLDHSWQSDGVSDFDYPTLENRAFRVNGLVVAEPATGGLLGLGFVALTLMRRSDRRARPRRRSRRHVQRRPDPLRIAEPEDVARVMV